MNVRFLMVAMTVLLGMFVVGPWTVVIHAQETTNMEIVREKLRTDKKFFIAQNMVLTESEAKAFWPVYDLYQKDLKNLGDREIKLIQDYARVFQSMDDATAKRLLNEALDIDADREQLRHDYLPKFRAVLTDKQVARYYQLEAKVHAVIDYELAANIPLVQ